MWEFYVHNTFSVLFWRNALTKFFLSGSIKLAFVLDGYHSTIHNGPMHSQD